MGEDQQTNSGCASAIDESVQRVIDSGDAAELRSALASEAKQRRRAECLANIQTEITKYTLDLLVRVPDLDAFFRALLKTLAEEGESHAAGVWLIDEDKQCCDFWMAHLFGEVFSDTNLGPTYFPRLAMAQFLFDYKDGWEQTNEYLSDDPRLPQLVRQFNSENGLFSTLVAPLILGGKNLGWITLCVAEEPEGGSWWRIALVEAIARHAALALHKSRIYEQKRLEERRKAILEERNRLARDIHDTLAQGFGAILMQLQAAQREGTLPAQAARNIDIAVDLAGHTAGNRVGALSRRPAPVQISYLGYPNTTGMSAIDYVITDVDLDPPGTTERWHTEKLIHLPRCMHPYLPPVDAPEVGERSDGPIRFGSFNRIEKLSDISVAAWAGVLRAAPDSGLTIKSGGMADAKTRSLVSGNVVNWSRRKSSKPDAVLLRISRSSMPDSTSVPLRVLTMQAVGCATPRSVKLWGCGLPATTRRSQQCSERLTSTRSTCA